MPNLDLYKPGSITGKLTTYAAKYNIEFFERKKIPSYALWSVYIKQGHRYPKIPQGFGAAATLGQATLDMRQFIDGHGIGWDYVRNDGTERWKAVKYLIVQRDFSHVPALQQIDKALL
jgi:hypothetical protein